jgi:type IV pilus assembly protein PilV
MQMNDEPHNKQGGFTLLEVLIALLVLSIGLLGLAALQTVGLRSNQMASMRTLATQYTYNITDRMRANPDGLTTTNQYYVIGVDDPTPVIATNCDSVACTTEQLADFDLNQWRAEVESLPGGKSQISQAVVGGVTVHTVTVHWNEARDPAVTGTTCPPVNDTDLRCIQLRI